ncbi:signal peptidase I [Gordonia caeni]|uniref:Signal peptidase I n=1 Tax=Gordonia caeni TaxID=1007097 RepID=A0ABP7NNK5_9ACTN
MTAGRGTHHDAADTRVFGSGPQHDGDDQESTPVSWWIKTIASWTLLIAAIGLLALLVVVPRLTGSTAYTVLTGSMEPSYPPGTLIVVQPTPGDQLAAGDVITFQPESGNPAVVTHRIVSSFYDNQGQRRFVTKGDANTVKDETMLVEAQIRGKLIYSVPHVGRINSVLSGSTRSVAVFVIAGGLGAYALWMWISSFRDRSRRAPGAGATADSEPAGGVDTADIPLQGSPLPPPRRPLAYSQCPEPRTAYSDDTRPFPTIE